MQILIIYKQPGGVNFPTSQKNYQSETIINLNK